MPTLEKPESEMNLLDLVKQPTSVALTLLLAWMIMIDNPLQRKEMYATQERQRAEFAALLLAVEKETNSRILYIDDKCYNTVVQNQKIMTELLEIGRRLEHGKNRVDAESKR